MSFSRFLQNRDLILFHIQKEMVKEQRCVQNWVNGILYPLTATVQRNLPIVKYHWCNITDAREHPGFPFWLALHTCTLSTQRNKMQIFQVEDQIHSGIPHFLSSEKRKNQVKEETNDSGTFQSSVAFRYLIFSPSSLCSLDTNLPCHGKLLLLF